MKTDVWTQMPDYPSPNGLIGGMFIQYGKELIYLGKAGEAIEYKKDTNTWINDWPDGVPAANFKPGRAVVYQ